MEAEEQGGHSTEEPAPAAYCRECGTPLSHESEIVVFEEAPHCAGCAAALQAPAAAESAPGEAVAVADGDADGWQQRAVNEEAYNPRPYSEPINPDAPNPVLALLLGLIPGVGAVYNGQYAKAVVHVITLGGLLGAMISSYEGPQVTTVFLVVLMFFYMPIEAFRTAQAMRNGEAVDEFSGFMKKGSTPSLTLAVALIVGGVLFLLHTLEVISLGEVQRFWPVILIVIGVRMLVTRARASEAEMQYAFAGNGQDGSAQGLADKSTSEAP